MLAATTSRFYAALDGVDSSSDAVVICAWVLNVALLGLLGLFFWLHCWLVANNFTTLELCEKRRSSKKHALAQASLEQLYSESPYDLGWYRNVCSVLGPVWSWLLPIRL